MKVTKLDAYDYMLLPGVIRIHLMCTNDPDVVDIMSEIERSDGRIYVEGYNYLYLDNYRLYNRGFGACIELDVVEVS